jgi:hypothetical protein
MSPGLTEWILVHKYGKDMLVMAEQNATTARKIYSSVLDGSL